MSYFYATKTDAELEQIAEAIRRHFPKRRLNLAIDILIEKDASGLASALLMPGGEFVGLFNAKLRELEATGAPEMNVLRETLKHLADVFQVSPRAAGYRACKLRLLTSSVRNLLFPPK